MGLTGGWKMSGWVDGQTLYRNVKLRKTMTVKYKYKTSYSLLSIVSFRMNNVHLWVSEHPMPSENTQ